MARQTPMSCVEDRREIPSIAEIKVYSDGAFEPSDDTSVTFGWMVNHAFAEDLAILVDPPTKVTRDEITVMLEVTPNATLSPHNRPDRFVLVSQPSQELISDAAVLELYTNSPAGGPQSKIKSGQQKGSSRKKKRSV